MGDLTGLIAVCAVFGVGAFLIISRSELGSALIERIRHGAQGLPDPQLVAEVDDLRVQLAEMQDRLEFAERQLATLKPGPPAGKGE